MIAAHVQGTCLLVAGNMRYVHVPKRELVLIAVISGTTGEVGGSVPLTYSSDALFLRGLACEYMGLLNTSFEIRVS